MRRSPLCRLIRRQQKRFNRLIKKYIKRNKPKVAVETEYFCPYCKQILK